MTEQNFDPDEVKRRFGARLSERLDAHAKSLIDQIDQAANAAVSRATAAEKAVEGLRTSMREDQRRAIERVEAISAELREYVDEQARALVERQDEKVRELVEQQNEKVREVLERQDEIVEAILGGAETSAPQQLQLPAPETPQDPYHVIRRSEPEDEAEDEDDQALAIVERVEKDDAGPRIDSRGDAHLSAIHLAEMHHRIVGAFIELAELRASIEVVAAASHSPEGLARLNAQVRARYVEILRLFEEDFRLDFTQEINAEEAALQGAGT